jgi:GntR family transcriptional regulator, carbon starvation induced regulator
MAKIGAAKTLARDIHQRIRADILCGRLAVGQRLKLADMAADYDVSPNIVREALTVLAGEKLVRTQPQQGFAVTSLTMAELRDLTNVRISIESQALSQSIANGGLEWEAELLAAHHRLANTPVKLDPDGDTLNEAYVEAHSAFHAALVSACGSPLLLEIRQSLHDASELYRRMAYLKRRDVKDTGREHKKLVQAALSRDVAKATSLLARHFEETTRICMETGLTDAPGVVFHAD